MEHDPEEQPEEQIIIAVFPVPKAEHEKKSGHLVEMILLFVEVILLFVEIIRLLAELLI